MEHGGSHSPIVGNRLNLHGSHGTIRYIGEVQGAPGTWLGIEWDNPARGKHSGEKNGTQYFSCSVPGAGTFVKLSPSISYGQTFLHALVSKYIELPHASGKKETVILGSSNGAIEVEAVGLNKVRAKLAKLDQLRQVSLDGQDVAFADSSRDIETICPNVQGLDLSDSLLASWETLAQITSGLPMLQSLILDRNRFIELHDTVKLASAFLSLKELHLNNTLITWSEAVLLATVMPNLRYLELGKNSLKTLGIPNIPKNSKTSKLEVLDLGYNELDEWNDIMIAISLLEMLDRVVLTSNNIKRIMIPALSSPIQCIKHVGLQNNGLASWHDVDALRAWLPNLENLSLSDNPLESRSSNFRQLTIARLPSLKTFNGTSISLSERSDCEIFYLSQIARSGLSSDEEKMKEHPRWSELCEKHGRPEITKSKRDPDTLAQRLVNISLYWCQVPPVQCTGSDRAFLQQLSSPQMLRVLPTMSMRVFKLKLLKAMKPTLGSVHGQGQLGAKLLMDDGSMTEIDLNLETKDLSWYGVQNGSCILLYYE